MKLYFRNNYGSTVWVAIMFYSPDTCREHGNWGTRGWWGINSGNEAFVLNTNNRYAAFYAEAEDGTIWNGTYGPVYVKNQRFESCINIGDTSSKIVGMHRIDMGNSDNHYVNLNR